MVAGGIACLTILLVPSGELMQLNVLCYSQCTVIYLLYLTSRELTTESSDNTAYWLFGQLKAGYSVGIF